MAELPPSAGEQTAEARNGHATAGQQTQKELAPISFYPSAPASKEPVPAATASISLGANGHSSGKGKPPLPPAARRVSGSDSDLSEIREEADSDFEEAGAGADSTDDDYDDDFSDDSSGRKRKRRRKREEADRKRFKTPEDNPMRQKLRGRPIEGSSAPEDSSRPASPLQDRVSETESEGLDAEEDPNTVPERVVSAELEAEQKAALKTDWELITIMDFLSLFQDHLGLHHLQFSAEELESCLVLNNGTSGLLPNLHIGIMKGISTRSNLQIENWAASLSEKLKLYWRVGRLPGRPPFAPQRRWEAFDYATLPLADRVTALRILCELRLERDDLHTVVEYALHPPKKTKAEKKAEAQAIKAGKKLPPEPVRLTMDDVRHGPLARDSSGLMYWYLDYHNTTGTRMYRETPSNLVKLKPKQEQSAPQWEIVGSSIEELTELAEKLRRSKKKPDQDLADLIFDEILPELVERREADLKRQRQAAKVQAQLNQILPEGGRSRRARKTVNYSYDAYDAAIKAALRSGNDDSDGPRATRSMAFHEPRMTAEEEMNAGYRRGRSARAASPPLELPPNRRVRREGRDGGVSDLEQPSNPPSNLASPSASREPSPSRTPTPHAAASQPGIQEPVPQLSEEAIEGEGGEPMTKPTNSGPGVEPSEEFAQYPEPMDEDSGLPMKDLVSEPGGRQAVQEGGYESSGGSAEEEEFVDDPTDANWE